MLFEHGVVSTETDNAAMELLEKEVFDLVLLSRNSDLPIKELDQRLREKYPDLLTLKIEGGDELKSIFPSRISNSMPEHVFDRAQRDVESVSRVNRISTSTNVYASP
jgi:hypothetical protein